MRKSLIILVGSIFCGFLIGCEQSADLVIPIQTSKLTVYSSFGTDDNNEWMFVVTRSKSVADTTSILKMGISDADIRVFEDGQLLSPPRLINTQQYYFDSLGIAVFFPSTGIYLSKVAPKAGSHYQLIVSSSDLETIEAETTIPPKVEIISVEIDREFIEDASVREGNGANARLKFKDPGNTSNFYHLFVTISSEVYNIRQSNILSPQLRINNPELNLDTNEDDIFFDYQPQSGGVYFRDAIFNGQEYEVSFSIADQLLVRFLRGEQFGESKNLRVLFGLRNLTEENYWYHVTTRLQLSIRGDPFAEPAQVRYNVEGGFGMFAGFNQDQKTIELIAEE